MFSGESKGTLGRETLTYLNFCLHIFDHVRKCLDKEAKMLVSNFLTSQTG